MRNLIAVSGKQYTGKDLLTRFLLDELPCFRQVPIAKAIKIEFANLYGLTPDDIEAQKSVYRSGLIALGQRRRKQNLDYWLQLVLKMEGPKIVSDMRLLHEYKFFKSHNSFMIRLEADRSVRARRGALTQENDPTECELDSITEWDAVIKNNGSVEELRQKAKKIAEEFISSN